MRYSTNEEINGTVKNGFDYTLQVWVKDYIIQDCGHKTHNGFKVFECCNARRLRDQDIREVKR